MQNAAYRAGLYEKIIMTEKRTFAAKLYAVFALRRRRFLLTFRESGRRAHKESRADSLWIQAPEEPAVLWTLPFVVFVRPGFSASARY